MKRTILVVLWLFLLLNMQLMAQLTRATKAKEGIDKAVEIAKDSGYTDPELLGIGTSPGDYDMGGFQIEIKYDYKTGKADGWAYMLRAADDTSKRMAVAVSKTFLGTYLAFGVPFDMLGDLPSFTSKKIDIDNIMDSDEMADYLNKNQKFNDYIKANKDAKLEVVGCFKNSSNPVFELGEIYWMLNLRNEGKIMICAVHAETGETQCNSLTSVAEIPDDLYENQVYPNPADGFIKLKLTEEVFNQELEISVYDLNGSRILHYDSIYEISEGEFLNIPVKNLSAGYYYLVIGSSNDLVSKPFVITR